MAYLADGAVPDPFTDPADAVPRMPLDSHLGDHTGLAGDLRLTDVEDEDVAEVTISSALLKRYKENLDGYCGKLREYCVRRGMMHITIDTATSLDTLLLDYLRKRGLLK